MMNEIDPIEYDAAFGNLLNDMMIAMEMDAMEEEINFELQALADEAKEEEIDLQFEEMMDALMFEHRMQEYAAHSYDQDAIFYGKH